MNDDERSAAPETPATPEMPAPSASPGAAADLLVEPEAACDLLSEHGGEIVIAPDGRIVFMNASEHLVELAHALDPENEDVRRRMEAIRRAREARGGGAAGPPTGA